jgi:hypothetical protein
MVLVDIANGKQRHVPYRDSKLTFLLQVSDAALVFFMQTVFTQIDHALEILVWCLTICEWSPGLPWRQLQNHHHRQHQPFTLVLFLKPKP